MDDSVYGYAHVVGGVVVNVSLWDGVTSYDPGEGVEMVVLPYSTDENGTIRYTAGIGWDYVDGEFVDNRPEPELS